MTKEEAIAFGKRAVDLGLNDETQAFCEMAIKALEQEPKYCDRNICIRNEHSGIGCGECEVTKSQESCEDAISREDTLARLRADTSFVCTGDKMQAIETVNNMPPVTPQPKTGHWIVGDGKREVYAMEYECSECGCNVIGGGDFCKWCGARMFEPQESEDKCKKCEYYINPDYTRCHTCKAESEDKE